MSDDKASEARLMSPDTAASVRLNEPAGRAESAAVKHEGRADSRVHIAGIEARLEPVNRTHARPEDDPDPIKLMTGRFLPILLRRELRGMSGVIQ